MRAAAAQAAATGVQVSLDLSAVRFVDARGRDVLVELRRQGVRMAACSRYVGELLGREE
jgi:hypothetical protein